MASSFYKGQIPYRAKGQTTCFHHKGRQLDIYCEDCQELACTKCLSTVHKKHLLCDISEITPKKKEDIQNFVDQTEKVELVQIDQYIASTDTQLKDNASHFEKLSHQLQTQTNNLKEHLDLLTAQTLSLYQQIEEDNVKLLQTYKQDLERYRIQLKERVKECKVTLQRGSDLQIFHTGSEILSQITLPVKPTLGTARFTPNRNPQSKLEDALGKVDTPRKGQGQALLSQHKSVVGQMSDSKQQQTERSELTRSGEREEFIAKLLFGLTASRIMSRRAEVLGDLESGSVTSVCPTTDGQVWTSFHGSDTLTLFDRKGNVIQEVTHNIPVKDISLSPTTNTLWVCDEENNITELVSGKLKHRFSTTEKPKCIRITASNHIIVGMNDHISKFTTEGELVLTTLTAGTWNPAVCIPWKIAECPVTHNVAIADLDTVSKKGEKADGDDRDNFVDSKNWRHRVVVMDKDFKELFVYNGKPGDEPFLPLGVVYDSEGNLFIGDSLNNRILLVSGRGEFRRIIYTDNDFNMTVGIDKKDDLWAVFGVKVKILHPNTKREEQPCVIL